MSEVGGLLLSESQKYLDEPILFLIRCSQGKKPRLRANDPDEPCFPRRTPGKLPKTVTLFGIVDIHDFHPKAIFTLNRLGKTSSM